MARKITVQCDVPGCKNHEVLEDRAGSLVGWGKREVKDQVKRVIVTGVQDFYSSTMLYLCPEHETAGEKLPPVPTPKEVAEWIEQSEKDMAKAAAEAAPPPLKSVKKS